MENENLRPIVVMVALGVGVTLFLIVSWGPVDRIIKKVAPDPDKVFKAMFIAGVALFALVGAAMSIAIMFKMIGGGR